MTYRKYNHVHIIVCFNQVALLKSFQLSCFSEF